MKVLTNIEEKCARASRPEKALTTQKPAEFPEFNKSDRWSILRYVTGIHTGCVSINMIFRLGMISKHSLDVLQVTCGLS